MSAEKKVPNLLMAALQAAREELGEIEKTGRNKFHGYDFVQAEKLFSIVRPVLHRYGIWIFQDIDMTVPPVIDPHGNTNLTFLFWICHTSGERLDLPIRVFASGCDRDSKGTWGDKGAYKANTGGWKYMLLRLFLFDSGEHEPEQTEARGPHEKEIVERMRSDIARHDAGGAGAERAGGRQMQPPKPEVPAEVNQPAPSRQPLPKPGYEPGSALASKQEIKNSKFYATAFKRVEQIYGDDAEEHKFAAVDWALAQLELGSPKEIRVKHLPRLVELARAYDPSQRLPEPDPSEAGDSGEPF